MQAFIFYLIHLFFYLNSTRFITSEKEAKITHWEEEGLKMVGFELALKEG